MSDAGTFVRAAFERLKRESADEVAKWSEKDRQLVYTCLRRAGALQSRVLLGETPTQAEQADVKAQTLNIGVAVSHSAKSAVVRALIGVLEDGVKFLRPLWQGLID